MLFACQEVSQPLFFRRARNIKPLTSPRLHFVVGRFMLAGLISNVIDYCIFLLVYRWTGIIFLSTYAARAVSMGINYGLVKAIVFHAGGQVVSTFSKYVILVVFSGLVVSLLLGQFIPLVGDHILVAKLMAEAIVFLLNFAIQRWFIFRRTRRAG